MAFLLQFHPKPKLALVTKRHQAHHLDGYGGVEMIREVSVKGINYKLIYRFGRGVDGSIPVNYSVRVTVDVTSTHCERRDRQWRVRIGQRPGRKFREGREFISLKEISLDTDQPRQIRPVNTQIDGSRYILRKARSRRGRLKQGELSFASLSLSLSQFLKHGRTCERIVS